MFSLNGDKISLNVDGKEIPGLQGQNVLQVLMSHKIDIPHVCFQPNLGPINTCDACLVKIDGKVVRSCSTPATNGMKVDYSSKDVRDLQEEALQRILKNHELYCTVCENNNGDCDLHNSVHMMEMNRQKYEFKTKPYEVDDSNPFYRYDPNQCTPYAVKAKPAI